MTKKVYTLVLLLLTGIEMCLSTLCEDCNCSDGVLDCTKSSFSLTGNTTIGSGITEGYFSGLSIGSIGKTTFGCDNCSIQLLDLSANYITSVPGKTFQLLNTLTRLNLRNNRIDTLKNNSFQDLLDLTVLDLGFNKIRHLPPDLLNELINLSNLDLKYNDIAHIPEKFFFSSKNLKTLDISHLRLESLPDDLFQWKLSIENLDISHNLFTVVPSEALTYLGDSLKSLKMSGNRIKTLQNGAFIGLRKLNSIQMEQLLQLQTIEAYAFSSMENLANVELRYLPELIKFHEKAFNLMEVSENETASLCPLLDFTLCFSTLPYLPSNLLDWNSTRQIMLRNNQWNCGCRMKWIKGSVVEEKTGSSMYCSYPGSLRGQNILALEESDFTCGARTTVDGKGGIILLIFIFVLGLIVSITTVAALVYRRNGWIIRRPRGFNLLQNETITVLDRSDRLPTISKPYQSTVVSNT